METAAASVSEFVRYSDGFVLQIPSIHILRYTPEVLGVILALLDDSDESVQLTAVSCLLMVLELSSNDVVEPILLNLSVRLRNLQICMNTKIRANAYAAFGALSNYGAVGPQREAFLEQVDNLEFLREMRINPIKEISKLRYELCPCVMKERKFWKIYFILVNSHVAPLHWDELCMRFSFTNQLQIQTI